MNRIFINKIYTGVAAYTQIVAYRRPLYFLELVLKTSLIIEAQNTVNKQNVGKIEIRDMCEA